MQPSKRRNLPPEREAKPKWIKFKSKVGFPKPVVDFVAGAHRVRREQHVRCDLQIFCSQHSAVKDGRAGEFGRQNTGQEGNVATFCLSLSHVAYIYIYKWLSATPLPVSADCGFDLCRDGDDRDPMAWLSFGAATQGEAQLCHELRFPQIPRVEGLILCVSNMSGFNIFPHLDATVQQLLLLQLQSTRLKRLLRCVALLVL